MTYLFAAFLGLLSLLLAERARSIQDDRARRRVRASADQGRRRR